MSRAESFPLDDSDGIRIPAQQTSPDDRLIQAAAAGCTLLLLLVFAQLLLHLPAPALRAPSELSSMQVSFIERTPLPTLPRAAAPPPPTTAHAAPASTPQAHAAAAPTRAQAALARPATADAPQTQFYTRDGRVRVGTLVDPLDPGDAAVPPGMTDERQLRAARKVMERVNPIDYQETRFAKDWKSDGTLGDVAMQELNRGMKRANKLIWGEDTQTAKARPPPDVRFNPALADNKADLGSEATGDAYKAAPIAHEPVPDLQGEASRRIRSQLAALENTSSRCDAPRRQSLLAPVRTHLADLERVEHALAHGADPVLAQQMLPRQADSAYDLARRALWYAERQLGQCRAAG